MIPIFYTFDDNYKEINESIKSLKGDCFINIMYEGEIDSNKFNNVNLIDMSKYHDSYIDMKKYYYILIPKYVEYEKIIYINSKSKVLSNLNEIFDKDISEYDILSRGRDHFIDDLLVINCKRFKELNLYEKLITFMNDYECDLIVSMNNVLKSFRYNFILDIVSDYKYVEIEKLQKNEERLKIVEKIHEYERLNKFDLDVEDDPETFPIKPNTVDFECKKLKSKINARISLFFARRFLNKMIKNKQIIINEVRGAENFKNLKVGAVITCNHFNAFDSFAIHVAYDCSKHKKQKFFRVIREGNYTNFPGFFGYLMRNCRTLPLSANPKVMGEFMRGCSNILKNNHFILIYPEQSMWWNYRKPKPLKPGGFKIAAKNNVAILPVFIGLKNSDVIGSDGFRVLEYTIMIEKPIVAPNDLSNNDKMEYLKNENYKVWKKLYEEFYNLPLVYEK